MEAPKLWLTGNGFELPSYAYDDLDFPDLPDRSENTTYGSAQLLDTRSRRVVSVVLKMEPEKGYVLYGTEGQLLQEL